VYLLCMLPKLSRHLNILPADHIDHQVLICLLFSFFSQTAEAGIPCSFICSRGSPDDHVPVFPCFPRTTLIDQTFDQLKKFVQLCQNSLLLRRSDLPSFVSISAIQRTTLFHLILTFIMQI
jgi:hypothetical protein